MFLIFVLSAIGAWTVLFLDRKDFSREAIVVYLISGFAVAFFAGLFVFKNRRVLEKFTEKPSVENFEILRKLLYRQKLTKE